MSNPTRAPASTVYTAAHNSGQRLLAKIRNVCVHSTEGDTAAGAAGWFQNPKSEGSANMCVDNDIAYRTLNDDLIPWAAPGLNEQGWHLEMAGYAHWTRAEWLKHSAELKRGAYKAALRCNAYKIPVRWVGPIGLRLGRAGLTTHRDVSYAWPILARAAGFHTDPGKGFPRDVFLSLVHLYLAELSPL